MDDELRFEDLIVAPEVMETIIRLSAEKIEGVAAVGLPSEMNGMFSFLSPKRPVAAPPAVSVKVQNEGLQVALHLTVFFGYPFITLAEEVRQIVASSLSSQLGTEVCGVDVYIDALVFPKE